MTAQMVVDTPDEYYDETSASTFLNGLPEEVVSKAGERLLALGVLSKVVNETSKLRPGRMLRISDM